MIDAAPLISSGIVDYTMEQYIISTPPQRIIVLDPAILETFFFYDQQSRVIAISQYCDYPSGYEQFPNIFISDSLNLENVQPLIDMAPDMVIASTTQINDIKNAKSIFNNYKIPLIIFDFSSVENVLHSMKEIAKLVEKTPEYLEYENQISNFKKLLSTSPYTKDKHPTITVISDVIDLEIVTKSHYLSQVIEWVGGKIVPHKSGKKTQKISCDQLIKSDPELLILLSSSDDIGNQLLENQPSLVKLNSIEQKNVIRINDEDALQPGPRIGRLMLILTTSIYPKVPIDNWFSQTFGNSTLTQE